MKIIKLPIETKITCECGCEFEFDIDDLEHQVSWTNNELIYSRTIVDCPYCKHRHTLNEESFNS